MESLDLSNLAERRKTSIFSGILSETHLQACFTCGTCSGGCPLTGMESTKDEGLDARKVIRMAAFGMDQEVIDSRFVWICTGCERCVAGCPMGVKLVKVWGAAKAARPRDKVPGVLHKGVDMVLKTGNNMGIPEDDYVTLLEELGEELAEECCPGFVTPVEKVGADYLHFQNSKEAYAEPDDMKWWWKIFYAAKADWTTSSKNWESVDWGIFTADMEASKEIARRKVENMKRLQAKTFILPDCGGASYGTRLNLEKHFKHEFGPETGHNYVYFFDVLLQWLEEGRIKVDKAVHAGRIVTWHDSCKHGRSAYFDLRGRLQLRQGPEDHLLLHRHAKLPGDAPQPHGILLLWRRRRQLAGALREGKDGARRLQGRRHPGHGRGPGHRRLLQLPGPDHEEPEAQVQTGHRSEVHLGDDRRRPDHGGGIIPGG